MLNIFIYQNALAYLGIFSVVLIGGSFSGQGNVYATNLRTGTNVIKLFKSIIY